MPTLDIPADTLSQLTALARSMCDDPMISVEARAQSHFDPCRWIIGIDPDSASDARRAQGIIAHESGHVRISRYYLWACPITQQRLWFKMLNALEDPRVDAWMMRRYPGSRPWFGAVDQKFRDQPVNLPPSLFLQFLLGACAKNQSGLEDVLPASAFHPLVAQALERTGLARQRYVETSPDPALTDDMAPPPILCDWPLQPETSAPRTRTELAVRKWALAALVIARDEILPHALELAAHDASRIDDHARNNQQTAEDLASGESGRRARAAREGLRHGHAARDPDSRDGDHQRRSAEALEDYLVDELRRNRQDRSSELRELWRRLAETRAGEIGEATEVAEDPPSETDLDLNGIERCIASQVRPLRKTLEQIMIERRRARWRTGFRAGTALDMRRAMRFEADPRDDRIWRRRLRPKAREAVVGLLVDLSGSMRRGGKIAAAIGATMMFAEALSGARIQFMISGFQDVLIPIAAADEGLTPTVRRRIREMALEVEDRREGGNNRLMHNDDGPCLDEFATQLHAVPATDRLLLVISDGEPAGSRSNDDDLRAAVARVSALPGTRLIGIGCGENTAHVRDFYPNSIAEVPVERLGEEISTILRRHCRLAL